MAVLNEWIEASLEAMGNKEARERLRAIAARVASGPPPVDMRCPRKAEEIAAARVWLHGQLPGWLARHG